MAPITLTDGWQSPPNQRGTIDILWSCLSTVFLCLWSMLHLNLPAPDDSYWTIFRRQCRWLVLGLLAPEVPMLAACGQWSSAKRSVQKMRSLGFDKAQWTMKHAFFADSGGFVLELLDEDAFPISAKQLAWLVERKYVELPSITAQDLDDKSKIDTFAKALAFVQTLWFMTQLIVRPIEGLPITPIELTSATISVASLTTLWFWLRKPLGVRRPYSIKLDSSAATLPHADTNAFPDIQVSLPLDEIEPRVYITREWSRHVFKFMRRFGLQQPRVNRIPNDRDPQVLGLAQHAALGIACAAFQCLHFVDWRFEFASTVELMIWRVSCLLACGLLGAYGIVEVIICWREGYQNLGMETAGRYKMRWPHCLLFHIPGVLYFAARLVIIAESFVGLRALPARAYDQIQWTLFIPHL